MKHKPWKTQSSRPIYSNRWMSLREDIAEMPDGRTTIYGVVTFGDCVGVVPFLDEDYVLGALTRHYSRKAVDKGIEKLQKKLKLPKETEEIIEKPVKDLLKDLFGK